MHRLKFRSGYAREDDMGIQDIIALSIAAAAALFAGRTVWRTMNAGGCTSCPSQQEARSRSESPPMRLARKPMITVDEVGLPESARKRPKRQ